MTLLHLQQASMQWKDTDKQTRQDFDVILSRGADAIGFTEVSPKNGNLQLLQDVARDKGYQVLWGPGNGHPGQEVATAVRDGLEVLDHGSVFVNKPEGGAPPNIGHSARYASHVSFLWEGVRVFLVEAHWVTGYGKDPERTAKHSVMSREIVRLVQEHGKGPDLAFFAGDVNQNEERDRGQDPRGSHAILTAGRLTTVWDELGVYLPTHGGKHGPTIDVIGSYDPDVRVSAHAVRVWPKLHTDHAQVSAWYDVAPRESRRHPCPTCGKEHRPPDQ